MCTAGRGSMLGATGALDVRRVLFVLMLVCATAGDASAAAYDDFARGLAANQRNDDDTAIAAFTAALGAPDLNPSYIPTAYRGRAVAQRDAGRCQPALDDIGRAIQLSPADLELIVQRALVFECLGQLDKAQADYSTLIDAKFEVLAWRWRGMLRFCMADFAGAVSDFNAMIAAEPRDVWSMLWLFAAREHTGGADPAAVEKTMHDLDSDEWPMPLFKLYAGKSKPEAVAAAVLRLDAGEQPNRQCEADFYAGEWQLARDPAAAKAMLIRAMQSCPRGYFEKDGARAELERLK